MSVDAVDALMMAEWVRRTDARDSRLDVEEVLPMLINIKVCG